MMVFNPSASSRAPRRISYMPYIAFWYFYFAYVYWVVTSDVDPKNMIIYSYYGILTFIFVATVINWRIVFPMIFVAICYQGFNQNFLRPNTLAFLMIDLHLIAVYLGVMLRRRDRDFVKDKFRQMGTPLMAFVVICCLQMINPAQSHLLVRFLGLKAYLLYIPLIFIAQNFFRSREQVVDFLVFVIVLSVPIAFLAHFQFYNADEWFSNLGSGFQFSRQFTLPGISGESFIRASGTFVTPSPFGIYSGK